MSTISNVSQSDQSLNSRSPLFDFLAKPNQYVPIFDAITRALEPTDIITLGRVSRDLRGVYQKCKDTQWNINIALKKFIKYPTQFRSKLGQVLVYPPTSSSKFQTLEHPMHMELCIVIIQTKDPPLYNVLKGYWCTTAETAFITATKAYAPFADMTLKTKKAYLLRALDAQPKRCITDVKARGYEVLDMRFRDRGKVRVQRLNDGSSWIMKLDTTDVEPPSVPDCVFDHAEFILTSSTNWYGPLHYQPMLRTFKHAALAHTWFVTSSGRMEPIARRLDAMLWMELCELPKKDRPTNWDELKRRKELLRTMTSYEGKMFDEKIPEWLEELDDLLPRGGRKLAYLLAKLLGRF
ncbi:uncharacterized protein BDZ99DRAFT_470775 [Mytilinidion resinicola]|uniref:Uncharacterized protein n=1 Tax=Mytilinidion resinicola TaxID=574789 RepID=A0A6A6Z9L7_9PEZI|nr:uncharacterized protein BDZ99DRAFT_470775 [Mytilinidion resinicola]KAF2817821.1 hypothetical protein BDZ99DRAFT_470775 [Mytilinidion resinicola]